MSRYLSAWLLSMAVLGGCHDMTSKSALAPIAGFVTDMPAFDRFIATHPTPEQFRAAYPDVRLVLPGTIATREFRHDNSRYFPKLDADGHIVGGSFM
jgi:hypothetical protein